jgi:2-dehydro-3-deoxygluconokinase
MTELVTFGETPLRMSPPENQRLEMARTMDIYADGMSSNVAVGAHELGAETMWLSKQPDTPLGRRVVTQVEEHGVTTDVTWTDDPKLRQGLTFRESASEPRESKYWQDRWNTAAASAEPSDFQMNLVQDSEMLFTDLSTPIQSHQAAETTQALLRAGGGGGAVTAVDLNYSPGLADAEQYRGLFEKLSEQIDVFFGNESDVQTVLDENGHARELANILAAEFDLDIVVITRAEHGAVALHDSPGTNVIHERETVDAPAVDPTGQHGAFIGGFLEELIRGSDAARALSVAVATAALARSIKGPHLTMTEDELEPIVDEVIDLSQ